jgi:HSP20 family protein
MAIIKWDPFKELMDIQSRMSRLFEDTVSRSRGRDDDITHAGWTPLVDIYETENYIILKAELPEIDQKDINLRIENDNLILEGERKIQEETKKENYYLVERAYGKFKRSFTLPSSVDAEKIKAEYKHGVLKVILPKREETKGKQITIDIK